MREKQRGPDILAKTSRRYQINMFLIMRNTITNGTNTIPSLIAYTKMVPIAAKPNMIKPTMIPKAIMPTNIPANTVNIVLYLLI